MIQSIRANVCAATSTPPAESFTADWFQADRLCLHVSTRSGSRLSR